ncbi:Mu transposase C-terminal domain-containing protein [Ruegeria arenilitoris]|uniref:Mu transposase C-terminal domain-containing protein n=1 Tax=Ruegeria arenilitoris TaxID=1173585 RepID=UPI001479B3E5|nr:Mu transposase C-terminal domain-containing protein [Ruegeria arenilitoris]
MSDWKSAEDWATEALTGLPTTKRNLNALAKRGCWQALGPEKARKRSGRGGGWEYHVTCLPEAAQAEFARRQRAVQAQTEVSTTKAARSELVVRSAADLSARHKRAMEARAAILREIDRRVFVDEISKRKAILSLIDDVKWDQQAVKDGREDQRVLTLELLAAAEDANDRGKSLSRSQIYDWSSAFAKQGITGLAPKKTRQKANQDEIYPWLPLFFRFYGRPGEPAIGWCIEKTIAEISDADLAEMVQRGVEPNYDKARRALKGLKGTSDHLKAFKGREGPLALKARLSFKRRTFEGMDPTIVYTADGKTFDAEIAHPDHGQPFRPEITTILDVVTRKLVGWSIDLAENKRAVADALRMACEQHGVPAIFYTDRGPGYRNEEMDHPTLGLCARLGTTPSHSLPYNSQARGIIERVNGSVWNTLAKEFPTYIGPDMDREAKMRVHKATRRDLKVNGTSRLLPSFAEFVERVEEMVRVYNDTPHSALRIRDGETGRMRKASPNEYWADFTARGFERVTVEPHEVDELFRPHVKRRTRRGEVTWLNNHYSAPELEPYHGMDVLVGYDIHNASKVWVRELEKLDGQEVPGRLICVAEFWHNKERYFPVSATEAAREKRVEGQLRRLKVKEDRVKDDLRAPLLEARSEVPLNVLTPVPEPEPIAQPQENVITLNATPAPQPDRRNPYGDPDIDLAWDIVEAPQDCEIPRGHIRLMTNLLSNRAAVDMMREVGLPLTDLADRIAAAQAPLKSSNGR